MDLLEQLRSEIYMVQEKADFHETQAQDLRKTMGALRRELIYRTPEI